ncbi:MAG: SDR family oxidoreductase [Fibrobacter sp.]|mgnify:CR=1 FL=1|nr:SDR family oxidoreductase [Fibrobacter sp.]
MDQKENREILECVSTLKKLAQNGELLSGLPDDLRVELFKAAGQLSRPDRHEAKKRNKEIKQALRRKVAQNDRGTRAASGIRSAREADVFTAPARITGPQAIPVQELKNPQVCYVCHKEYTSVHFFYDALCPECADFNYRKRFQTASLDGKVALITGSRLKIGYQATLMLLRAGARVIATTRFPVDSALRYSREKDFQEWGSRLQIFGLDLRHTPSVEIFCGFLERNYDRLDILINNAAQTVRRPPGFYAHLMNNECMEISEMPADALSLLNKYNECKIQLGYLQKQVSADSSMPVSWSGNTPGMGIVLSARLSQVPYSFDNGLPLEEIFPEGKLDADLQQVDLRKTNSWRARLGENEIPTAEMLELQLVNSVAPFVLCNKLIPLMKRDYTGQKHIVNVSAMEGKFFRWTKGERHPHTNMAKAALNMLTHTSAGGLAKYGIYMNAVDTGWVTDEDPAELVRKKQQLHDFQPPLDIVDGAARVCDPFFDGILTGKHWCGKFLKDYRPIEW